MKKVTVFFFILFSSSLLIAQVNQQWVQRYNGIGNGDDKATDIAVDGSGNVYVTGYSYGNGTGYDYLTVKYNSAGVLQWEQRFNGVGYNNNNDDFANSIGLDEAGNVYVTGYIDEYPRFCFATIKYNSAGVQQWVQKPKGPYLTNQFDSNTASLAVDILGNVYVCGGMLEGMFNCLTLIKYDSAGELQWMYQNFVINGHSLAYSIALDNSGNVYITGDIFTYACGSDIVTIKFNSDGVKQWEQIYGCSPPEPEPWGIIQHGNSIAVDIVGNVYITGYLSAEYPFNQRDYLTLKYNSNGVQQWVQIKDYIGKAYSIAVDSSGNSYITGMGGTIKYNTNGVQQWMQTYPGNYITLDGFRNAYVSGTNGSDYAVIKYDTDGVQQWIKTYNGPGNGVDQTSSIVIDVNGNVFVTGSSAGSGTGIDFATIKYEQFPLPVELLYFRSAVNKNDVTLKWCTEREINNKGFEIMRSSEKDDWRIMGFINGFGTMSEPMNYTFTDSKLGAGKYNYRLKQIDYNGNFENFDLPNTVNIGIPDKMEISQNYPNPSNPKCRISYSIPKDGNVLISIYDVKGREISVLVNGFKKADYYAVEFDGSNFASGVYFYRIVAGKFTQTKKMVLIK